MAICAGQETVSGKDIIFTNVKYLGRYRGYIRYSGPRYRGLLSFLSAIFNRGGVNRLSRCHESHPTI